jgi:methylated-DNA-[protein]-cysteine S-methyltransferase
MNPAATLTTRRLSTPVGALFLTASPRGLVRVAFAEPPDGALPSDDHPILARAAEALDAWFAGTRTALDLPLDVAGTPFQERVRAVLRAVPFGETRTYGQIAAAVGKPTALRAVGACNSRNPLLIVIPCHRVIGASGGVIGWSGGTDAKRWLLAHERRIAVR